MIGTQSLIHTILFFANMQKITDKYYLSVNLFMCFILIKLFFEK